MKRRGKSNLFNCKKGQASIIVIVLLILLVLIAIILVWNIVIPLLTSSSKTADNNAKSLNLRGNGAYSFYNNNKTILIRVDRDAGAGNISGVQFVLMDKSGKTYTITNNTVPRELESKIYNFSSSQFGLNNFSSIYKVTIYFLFTSKDNSTTRVKVSEKEGAAKDITSGGGGGGSDPDTCVAKNCIELGKNCGVFSTGCYGNTINCGSCSIGKDCDNGACVTCTPDSTAITCGTNICGSKINNCGGVVNCGSCPDGKYCNAGACTDTVCDRQSNSTTCADRNCGSNINNCGEVVDCGSCSQGQECKNDGTCGSLSDCFNINDNPVKICTCNDLQRINQSMTKNYILNNNIDCSMTKDWNCDSQGKNCSGFISIGNVTCSPIPYIGCSSVPFSGIFDGMGYKITGLTGGALFLSNQGILQNINLEDINITRGGAGLVSANYNKIINCSSSGIIDSIGAGSANKAIQLGGLCMGGCGIDYSAPDVTGTTIVLKVSVGGLTGLNMGTIKNSHTHGIVIGDIQVGGLVGLSNGDEIDCYSDAMVIATEYNAGGLVGCQLYYHINNSYSTGDVYTNVTGGGLVGIAAGGADMQNSFASGNVTVNYNKGGLIGSTWGDMPYNTYYYNTQRDCLPGLIDRCSELSNSFKISLVNYRNSETTNARIFGDKSSQAFDLYGVIYSPNIAEKARIVNVSFISQDPGIEISDWGNMDNSNSNRTFYHKKVIHSVYSGDVPDPNTAMFSVDGGTFTSVTINQTVNISGFNITLKNINYKPGTNTQSYVTFTIGTNPKANITLKDAISGLTLGTFILGYSGYNKTSFDGNNYTITANNNINGTKTAIYWGKGLETFNNCDGAPVVCKKANDYNYFYNKNNPPMNVWDFSNNWLEIPTNYPQLR